MRVLGRALVLGSMVALCAPAGASASPLLDQIGATGCTLVADPTLCTITVINDFADMDVTGQLVPDNGVALFAFELTDPTTFSIFTTSATSGFDPALGLFYGDDSDPLQPLGQVVTYSNSEGEFRAISYDIDINTNFDAQLDLSLDAGVYLLALLQYPNEFTSGLGPLESLQAGFTCDDAGVGCAFTGGTYAFTIDVDDGVPAPVPEPGTLTLMAGGALAGLIQRRRSKKRNRAERVSR